MKRRSRGGGGDDLDGQEPAQPVKQVASMEGGSGGREWESTVTM